MKDFEIPAMYFRKSKSIRFPVDVIDAVNGAIYGKDLTFSAFVVESVRWALKNLKEQEEEQKASAEP